MGRNAFRIAWRTVVLNWGDLALVQKAAWILLFPLMYLMLVMVILFFFWAIKPHYSQAQLEEICMKLS